MDIKQKIVDCINLKIDGINLKDLIIESVSKDKGDYCLPCFAFAKILKENPMNVATKISETVNCSTVIKKCEAVAGYVNFFLDKEKLTTEILENFNILDYKFNQGENKTVCIDYCSPNLAKYLHIGHLKSLIQGECLARLFEQCGYTVKRLNFIGDYGTPFGKIIGGMNIFGNMEQVEKCGNDALQDFYVKFNQLEAQDEKYSQLARDIFKKIEDKDAEVYPVYKKIVEISLKDAKEKFELLGVKFDDLRGEMYYNDFVPNFVKMLKEKNLLAQSEGALIVDLTNYDMPAAIIIKSDGTTLYMIRDLSASLIRYNDYKFDKMIYLTGVEQILHFKQWFKIVELMGLSYANNLEHIPYGRFSLPDGKISSRRGKQAVLVDLLEYAEKMAKEVVRDRTFTIEKADNVAKKVARSVLNFNVLKVERIKDCVFDVEKAFLFDGETAPYMQYTYTRLKSILRKYNAVNIKPDYSSIDDNGFELVKLINNFGEAITSSLVKRDPSIIVKRVMDLCKIFNKMYTNCKILDGNDSSTLAKINLVKALVEILQLGFKLICIDTIEEM